MTIWSRHAGVRSSRVQKDSEEFKGLKINRSLDEKWHQIRLLGVGPRIRVQIGRLLFSESPT